MKNKNVAFMTQAAMIAAIYVVLTYIFAPISFGEIQVRIAEALTIPAPLYTGGHPGTFHRMPASEMWWGGALLPDIIFGSLATVIGAVFTWLLRSRRPVIAHCLPSFPM